MSADSQKTELRDIGQQLKYVKSSLGQALDEDMSIGMLKFKTAIAPSMASFKECMKIVGDVPMIRKNLFYDNTSVLELIVDEVPSYELIMQNEGSGCRLDMMFVYNLATNELDDAYLVVDLNIEGIPVAVISATTGKAYGLPTFDPDADEDEAISRLKDDMIDILQGRVKPLSAFTPETRGMFDDDSAETAIDDFMEVLDDVYNSIHENVDKLVEIADMVKGDGNNEQRNEGTSGTSPAGSKRSSKGTSRVSQSKT